MIVSVIAADPADLIGRPAERNPALGVSAVFAGYGRAPPAAASHPAPVIRAMAAASNRDGSIKGEGFG
jgi:hypothetical protein